MVDRRKGTFVAHHHLKNAEPLLARRGYECRATRTKNRQECQTATAIKRCHARDRFALA